MQSFNKSFPSFKYSYPEKIVAITDNVNKTLAKIFIINSPVDMYILALYIIASTLDDVLNTKAKYGCVVKNIRIIASI